MKQLSLFPCKQIIPSFEHLHQLPFLLNSNRTDIHKLTSAMQLISITILEWNSMIKTQLPIRLHSQRQTGVYQTHLVAN